MKLRLTVVLLLLHSLLKAQTLSTLEYYFDTDPGYGNGTLITLSTGSNLDSIFQFSVSGLQAGMHSINIRLKNSNNEWSHSIYNGNFLVWNGANGTPQVTMLGYFLDSASNLLSLPLTGSSSIDTTISINIPDNGTDSRTLALRLGNQTGQLGNYSLASVSLCNLYNPEGGFLVTQYGNIFTLLDTSRYNPGNKIQWLINNSNYDSSYMTNYVFPANTIGSKTVTQITGTGCRKDTVIHTISMQGVESAEPGIGTYNNDFVLNIYGGGLDTSMSIYLQKGDTLIFPYLKYLQEGTHLVAVFDFHNYQSNIDYGIQQNLTDYYQLHAIFGNGYHYTGNNISFIKSFAGKIECAINPAIGSNCPPADITNGEVEPYYALALSGVKDIRTGVWNNLSLNITNTGYAVAKGVPFDILIPAHFDVDTTGWNIVTNNPGLRDSISIMVPWDTVVNGEHIQYKLYSLIAPVIGSGETIQFPFRIRTNTVASNTIYYWADKRMFGSPLKIFWPPCFEEAFNFAIGFVPLAGCLNGVFDMTQGMNLRYGNHKGKPDGVSMSLSVAGTIVSCVPTGKVIYGTARETFSIVREIKGLNNNSSEIAKYIIDKKIAGLSGLKNIAADGACSEKTRKEWDKADYLSRAGYDPNQITGNNQFDSIKHFVNNYSTQKYRVDFENLASATANTQHVYIIDTLKPNEFVYSSFKINGFSIGDSSYGLPSYRKTYTTDVALKNRIDLKVRLVMKFDTTSGILRTDFFSIDTSGKVLPLESLDGFLPPNTDGTQGTGSISFEIAAKDRSTLQTFSNQAHIYFDNNPPVPTNIWLNTIDTTAPSSRIMSAISVNDTTFKLVLEKSDIGSGVKYFHLYGKSSTDSLFRNFGLTIGDTILFNGDRNKSYQLFVKATDNVNLQEHKDSVAEVSVTFSQVVPLSWLLFSGRLNKTKVDLHWVTSNEQSTSHFEIEKAADAINYSRIEQVAAKGYTIGSNDYTTFDLHPFVGNNYYRLKQVDRNGRYAYSPIVKIYNSEKGFVILSPNPAKEFIEIKGTLQVTQIQLLDISGRLIKSFTASANNRYPLTGCKKGMYLVRMVVGNEVLTDKLLIE